MTQPTHGDAQGSEEQAGEPVEPRFKSTKLDLETWRRSGFARDSLMKLGLAQMPERMRARVREALVDHSDVPRHKGTIGRTVAIALALDLLFDALELTWPVPVNALDDSEAEQ